MALLKCKMCGGSLDVNEDMTVGECEYCGTKQTLPKTDSEQNVNLFNRANHFRQQCDFDRAAELYEKMTSSINTDPELFWSIVLCRYGIEYVDDPLTKKKIPTCHRTQYNSILNDPDYQTALKYADLSQRSIYETEAAYIDKVQKGILEISNKEQPFDVFICYKETDDNGRRTPDSVLAQELYYGLIQEGFKVFFSRITLESKLGTEYEPYIFAALNSSRVMVVVGTKPEHFNAVWVRNEWGRYLSLMQNDRKRTIIPAYRDMDPYDLPDALSMFQAQNMSKLGFMQDLIRGIRKILKTDKDNIDTKNSYRQQSDIKNSSGINIENYLKRGYLCLEDEKWKDAVSFFEHVLNEDVEEYRAYIGKLCAELHKHNESELASVELDFTVYDNYKKACRFGGEDVKTRLFEYNQQGLYDSASKALNNANDRPQCEKAKYTFLKLGDYRDSAQKADKCELKALVIEYNNALEVLNSAETEDDCQTAKKMFTALGDYNDSAQKTGECDQKVLFIKYNNALEVLNSAKTEDDCQTAKKMFTALDDYNDSAQKTDECDQKVLFIKYNNALNILNEAQNINDCQMAQDMFSALGDYRDSAEKVQMLKKKNEIYIQGIALCKSDDLDEKNEGLSLLNQIPGYLDADAVVAKLQTRVNKELRRREYEIQIHEIYDAQKKLYEETANLGLFSNKRKNEIACILQQLAEKEQTLKEEYRDIFD